MTKFFLQLVCWMLVLPPAILAAPKPHVITFGKPMKVQLFAGIDESRPPEVRIRALYVDGKLKEFITGTVHNITDQQFAVQRAYRVNDSLPQDNGSLPKWRWQRGAWLFVNRANGRITLLRLPDFDPFYSHVAWFREYAAYCGTSENGEKLYAVVAQLGIRKPLLHKPVRSTTPADTGQECGLPAWQRQPARVTFEIPPGPKLTFDVRGRSADVVPAVEPPAKEENPTER